MNMITNFNPITTSEIFASHAALGSPIGRGNKGSNPDMLLYWTLGAIVLVGVGYVCYKQGVFDGQFNIKIKDHDKSQ